MARGFPALPIKVSTSVEFRFYTMAFGAAFTRREPNNEQFSQKIHTIYPQAMLIEAENKNLSMKSLILFKLLKIKNNVFLQIFLGRWPRGRSRAMMLPSTEHSARISTSSPTLWTNTCFELVFQLEGPLFAENVNSPQKFIHRRDCFRGVGTSPASSAASRRGSLPAARSCLVWEPLFGWNSGMG